MNTIQEISIVGMGLVGQTLARYFDRNSLKIKQIAIRKPIPFLLEKVEFIDSLEALKPVDLVLVCVNDAELHQVISKIPEHQFSAFTSGAIGLDQFALRENLAVFYPLQSFAHLNPKAVSKTPILIETQSYSQKLVLEEFALRFFETCQEMNSKNRAELHLAAVFANNFTNHLIHIAQNQCEKNNLPFELLKPLIAETAKKWMEIPANQLQTGPAARGDQNVIDKHKSMLSDNALSIYELLTQSITKNTNSD